MRTMYPNKIQSFGVYDTRGALGAANYSNLTDAQLQFGRPGLLDRVVGDLIPTVEEDSEDVLIFGTNYIKLTLNDQEHLERIPYNEHPIVENKICNILGGWSKTVSEDYFGYTRNFTSFL